MCTGNGRPGTVPATPKPPALQRPAPWPSGITLNVRLGPAAGGDPEAPDRKAPERKLHPTTG
jgi:hypothetical protein